VTANLPARKFTDGDPCQQAPQALFRWLANPPLAR